MKYKTCYNCEGNQEGDVRGEVYLCWTCIREIITERNRELSDIELAHGPAEVEKIIAEEVI